MSLIINKKLMSENSIEESSLKASEQFSELSILSKDKIIKNGQSQINNKITSEVITSIIIIIISISFIIFYCFQNKIFDYSSIFKSKVSDKQQVISCEDGHYIPNDDKSQCKKCTINFCSKCTGNTKENTCLSCMENYEPIKDSDNKIKECTKTCDKGKDNKCLTCDGGKCGTCNLGYKLYKGKCIDNFSIKGSYTTTKNNQKILLLNKLYVDYLEKIIIDDKILNPSYNFTFEKKGEHKVLMLLNNKTMQSGKMMFFNVSNLISIEFTKHFKTEHIVNMRGMFKDCKSLQTLDITNFNTEKVTDLSYMFDNCISLESVVLNHIDTRNARDISYMFANCKKLKSLSLNNFNPINIVDMTGLFYGCSSLEQIDLEKFVTKKVEFMSYMFPGCSSLPSVKVSHFKTDNVKDMSYIFQNCSKLNKIDLNGFDTHNVRNMEGMFEGCSSLSYVDLKNFKTKNMTKINKIFYGCSKLEKIDISSFEEIKGKSNLEVIDLFDNNSSKKGKIKVNKKFYECIKENIPSKWEVEFENNKLIKKKN